MSGNEESYSVITTKGRPEDFIEEEEDDEVNQQCRKEAVGVNSDSTTIEINVNYHEESGYNIANTSNNHDHNIHDTFSRYQGRFVPSNALNAIDNTVIQKNDETLTGDQVKLFYDSIINTAITDSPVNTSLTVASHSSRQSDERRKRKKISKSDKKKHHKTKIDDNGITSDRKVSKLRKKDRDTSNEESYNATLSTATPTKPDLLDVVKKDIATLFRLCEGQHGANNLRELRAHLVRIASLSSSSASSCTVASNIEQRSSTFNEHNADDSGPSSRGRYKSNAKIEYIKIINSSDQYGWTALMCAAASNNLNAVKLLIQEGARYTEGAVVDKGGYTLRDICARNGATDVEVYLSSLEEQAAVNRKTNTSALNYAQVEHLSNDDDEEEMVECEPCGVTLRKSMLKKHETSMSHLLQDSSKILPDQPYTIPEHNVGFQMMLRTGWEQRSGLGPDGSGRKRPIKTTLKLDKSGLGLNKTTERVSHFKAGDLKAVGVRTHKDIVVQDKQRKKRRTERSTTVATASKKREKQRSRFWERDMRRYMSTDD